jgi:hypothetical protein
MKVSVGTFNLNLVSRLDSTADVPTEQRRTCRRRWSSGVDVPAGFIDHGYQGELVKSKLAPPRRLA